MATTIITKPSGNVWSSMLGEVKVSTTEDVLYFSISTSNAAWSIQNQALYKDSDGYIIIRQLRELLEPVVRQYGQGAPVTFNAVFNIPGSSAVGNFSFTAYYCAIPMAVSVDDFLPEYFLSMQLKNKKWTSASRSEFVHFYTSASVSVQAICTWERNGVLSNTTVNLGTVSASSSIQTKNVSSSLFTRSGYRLVQYIIKAGTRTATFIVDQDDTEAIPALVFENSFGCQETYYHEGLLTADLRPDRDEVLMNGQMGVVDVRDYEQFTAAAVAVPTSMRELACDMLRTHDLWLLTSVSGTTVTGRKLVITDYDRKWSTAWDDLHPMSFAYRFARRADDQLQVVTTRGRIFDDTFDYTFN